MVCKVTFFCQNNVQTCNSLRFSSSKPVGENRKVFVSIKRFTRWVTPFALLLIAFFSYGVFAFQEGFHWDDWGFAWLIRTLGRPGLFDYFATNRPFLAYVYSVTTSIFDTNPVAWQLFSLLMRWLTAVSLLWVLRLIWPQRQRETFLATVFFLVYPGFNQQAVAITYSHFFLAQTLLFTSIGLMLLFARQPRRFWWAGLLGVLFAAYQFIFNGIFLWSGITAAVPALAGFTRGMAGMETAPETSCSDLSAFFPDPAWIPILALLCSGFLSIPARIGL